MVLFIWSRKFRRIYWIFVLRITFNTYIHMVSSLLRAMRNVSIVYGRTWNENLSKYEIEQDFFLVFDFNYIFAGCEESNSDTVYKRIDFGLNLIVKKLYVVMVKILLPCYMFPLVLLSIFKYVSSNHSNDSFQQIFPATWVQFNRFNFWLNLIWKLKI